MSKHMWEEHTKQKKTRDCRDSLTYLALTTQFRVQAQDVEEVRRPFRYVDNYDKLFAAAKRGSTLPRFSQLDKQLPSTVHLFAVPQPQEL